MNKRVEGHFRGGGWTNGLPANMDDAVEQISLLQGDLRRIATKLAQVTTERDALVDEMEWAISELNADPTTREIASIVDSMTIALANVTESPALTP